ncbi:SHOCT domain-containing protein [Mycobacterium stomatepiae]|uniref:SHOCT domain-containing protein n=1 Tax=Mycobacterium stomatepiae TaxID=470076 RepID=UPI0021F27A30|nr:SHOCT domain-containing protein [Mycobacterium stomatepiae]
MPQGWASAAPEVRLVAQASPIPSAAPSTGSSPGLFSGMPVFGGAPLTQLPGRGASNSRDRRAGGTTDAPGVLVPAGAAPRDSAPARANTAELREITDLLGKLAQLRDSGALTDAEFSQQKQRLLATR